MLSNTLANVTIQFPDVAPLHIIPIAVLGLLLAAALFLELRDEDTPTEGEHRPVILGLGLLSLLGLIGYFLNWSGPLNEVTFNGMLHSDGLSRAAGLLVVCCALLTLLAAPDELERFRNYRSGEFSALIFAASLGMVMMASANSTMVMFLGLELFSIALYLLCIFLPEHAAGRESGIKYFLLSSAASAVLLYGLALLYGATGSTWLSEMAQGLGSASPVLVYAGAILVLSGLMFKLAVVPFHFWAPDVYEGAPTTVTAFMSVATKVAALAFLWRLLLALSNSPAYLLSILVLFALSCLSILVGNLMALAQTNVKRILAYSGVANAGYLLIAPVAGPDLYQPLMFFLFAYLLGNMGAFLALSQIEAELGREVHLRDLPGTFQRNPWLAGAMAICLFSLAGLPPAAGFLGKFYLFGKAMAAKQFWLPVFGILGSLVGAGYYIGTAARLFVAPDSDQPEGEQTDTATASGPAQLALAACVLGVIYLGVAPSQILGWLTANGFPMI